VIGNDGQFTSTNGVVGGSGSESDPYIIEKLVIDASSQDGIYNLGPLDIPLFTFPQEQTRNQQQNQD
jgi:hypothetical protein